MRKVKSILVLLACVCAAGSAVVSCEKECPQCEAPICDTVGYVTTPIPDLDITGRWRRVNDAPTTYYSDILFMQNTYQATQGPLTDTMNHNGSDYFGWDCAGNYTIIDGHFYKWHEVTALEHCVLPFPTNLEWIFHVQRNGDTLRFDYRTDLDWDEDVRPSGPAVYVKVNR